MTKPTMTEPIGGWTALIDDICAGTAVNPNSGDPFPQAPFENIEIAPELAGREAKIKHINAETVTWAAWLYYGEGKTQSEVATELKVSRASIANYLTEARKQGLVTISLDPDLLARMQIGRELQSKFGLSRAHIIPSSESDLTDRLGNAGAHVLMGLLKPNDILGVAWGRTMLALARNMAPKVIAGLKIAQIAGSSLGGGDESPEFCTALIASKLGARCKNFHAPAVVSSTRFRDLLMQEPAIRRHFDLINRCDHVVFGVASLQEDSLFADADAISTPVVQTYVKNGAICAAIGRLLDRNGNEVPGPIAGRIIGMDHEAFRKVPNRICVTGGPDKVEPVHAMLKGGFVTELVTDLTTARALMEF